MNMMKLVEDIQSLNEGWSGGRYTAVPNDMHQELTKNGFHRKKFDGNSYSSEHDYHHEDGRHYKIYVTTGRLHTAVDKKTGKEYHSSGSFLKHLNGG